MAGRPGSGSIVFAGLARDVAPFLATVTKNIENFAGEFDAWAVLIAENDSTDDTKARLKAWMAEAKGLGASRASLIEMDGLAAAHPIRTDRIATARNRLFAEIEQDENLRGFDYLAIFDMDFPNSCPLDPVAFRQAAAFLDSHDDVGGVFANSLPLYYDIWALREKNWCPGDCWQQVREEEAVLGRDAAIRKHVFDRQRFIPPASQPIAVDSAFGGVGLYRLGAVLGKRYAGLDSEGRETCEHIGFHQSIRDDGKRFFILPGLLNLSAFEHTSLTESHGLVTLHGSLGSTSLFAVKPVIARRARSPQAGVRFAQLAALYSRQGGNAILDVAPQGGIALIHARLEGCSSPYICAEQDETGFAILSANMLLQRELSGSPSLMQAHAGDALSDPGASAEMVRLCTGNDSALLSVVLEALTARPLLWARIEGPDEAASWQSLLPRLPYENVIAFNALGVPIISGPLAPQQQRLSALFPRLPQSGGGLDLVFFAPRMNSLFEAFPR